MEQTIASPKADTGNRQQADISERPVVATLLASLAVIWRKIRARLWSVRNKLTSDITPTLDVEQIIAHLGIDRRAEEEGSRGIPPPGEDVLTGTQREIVAYFSSLRRRARRQAANDADKLRTALDDLKNSDSLANLRDVPASCEKSVIRYVADVEVQLNKAVELEHNERLHYDAFRQKHGLDRAAFFTRKAYRYFLVVPILILAVAFALTNSAGIFQSAAASVSMVWVVAVSVAAIVIPFALGNSIIRWVNHVSEFRNLIGLIGVAFSLAVIAAIALYANFHIAAGLANTDASNRTLLDTILASPMEVAYGIADWKSFAVLAMTGLLAMLLGYRSDDPYPGYGALQRRYYKARDARDELFVRLRRRINSMVDRSEAEIANICRDFKKKVRVSSSLVEKSDRAPLILKDFDAELEDACNVILERYRSANKAVRKIDLPLSFAEHVCFNPDSDTDALQIMNGRGQVTELQTTLAELEKEAELARQKLRDLNVRMINSISQPRESEGD